MLLLRVFVILIACWIVKCDLLDLYVQHMDETMRTKLYSTKRHPIHPISKRIKRSPEDEEPLLKVGYFKKQRLDVDEEWLKQWKAKKRVSYQNDALDYMNKREENHDPNQHETLSNPEEMTISEAENSSALIDIETVKLTSSIVKDETNGSHYETIEEQKEVLKDELPTVLENQTDVEELVIESLDSSKESPKEEWEEEETEDEDNSQFEIISENEQINPKLFDDSSFKRIPKLWGNRIPKKYFPPIEKSFKKDKMITRSRRSAKKSGVNRIKARVPKFTRYEKLDEDGDVILEWDPSNDEEVTFRVTGKTLGYVGIGFNEKSHMMGADILLAWVDDHTGVVNLLVSRTPTRPYSYVTMVVDR